MSKINLIQKAILGLDGGAYQKFMDSYLYKKYEFNNIEPLGSHTGSDKVTKGTPDSYVRLDNGKYILIMYGSVETISYEKLEKDIESCFNKDKLDLPKEKIEKIICCYTSTNIHVEQEEKLINLIEGVKIEPIGIGTVSEDILLRYPFIAADRLNIQIDTNQIFEINDFVEYYDKRTSSPIDMDIMHRECEIETLYKKLEKNKVLLVLGKSGIGKTRLALEVCRKYKKEYKAKVCCIKGNGNILYDDLKYFISDKGEYLIFVDDANQITYLNHVIDYVAQPPEDINVKIIMTVRDYAKEIVEEKVYDNVSLDEEIVKELKEEDIKDILEKNLQIKNNDFLRQICKISKGNVRLAIMAGIAAKEKGYNAIVNSKDIFKYYYGSIIDKYMDSKNKVISACIISLFGPFEYKESKLIHKILNEHNIEINDFIEFCYELNKDEIIDLYMNKLVKISDQSMGDYLLYYVLIEKKYICISDLIKSGFMEAKGKIIYALNTILSIFNSNECFEYISYEVNKYWNEIKDDSEELEYVKCFHVFNEEKSLVYIKKKIDAINYEEYDLRAFDFDSKKNNHNIRSEYVEILGEFKDCKNYQIAIELLIEYFKKKPTDIMFVYFALTDKLGFNENSFNKNYEDENILINTLWKQSKGGEDVNVIILLLHVSEFYLKYRFDLTEFDGRRNFQYSSAALLMCNGLINMRENIFRIIGLLYSNSLYFDYINKILIKYTVLPYFKGDENTEEIFRWDLSNIEKYIFNKILNPDFTQCKLYKHFIELNRILNLDIDKELNKYKQNNDFCLYEIFSRKYYRDFDFEQIEQKRKERIIEHIKSYKEEDYSKLFDLFRKIEDAKLVEAGEDISGAIVIIFQYLKDSMEGFISVVRLYLENQSPFIFYSIIVEVIDTLINFIGINETKKIIIDSNVKKRNTWICSLLYSIPVKEIDNNDLTIIYNLVNDELNKSNSQIPNIKCLKKFTVVDKDIIPNIALKIINESSDNKWVASNFLRVIRNKEDSEECFNLFENHEELLEKLYLICDNKSLDYYGYLFIALVRNNKKFLKEYTLKMIDKDLDLYDIHLARLWEEDNYNELVELVFDIEVDRKDRFFFMVQNSIVGRLLINDNKTSDSIKERKIKWLKQCIDQKYINSEYMNIIFELIAFAFKNKKIEFILYFLSKNKNISDFKKIPLFPSSCSWSGSEVPLIEAKIEFLKSLKDKINGSDYLEHKVYLKKRIENQELNKKQVLLSEYKEDVGK
ncbi:hypothetical protein Q604_UNBC18483G0005 [human gut metagenome]|uniref:Novel STAND NTPase 3 domain-containing protein n=1 Tax=human gut metagenome TaxID=408170 RepID=W1WTG0_9ZZZZ